VNLLGKIRFGVKALFRIGDEPLAVGAKAPDFDASDHRGNRIRLSDYRGKKVVLWFFPMADTPG
jgi:peroxiredoxin Q/BCP